MLATVSLTAFAANEMAAAHLTVRVYASHLAVSISEYLRC